MSLYIGLMSGTSMDGVDATLVQFSDQKISVIQSCTTPYPGKLRAQLGKAIAPGARLSLHDIGTFNVSIGRAFAKAAQAILKQTETQASQVVAIGSHGQTLRHSPESDPPYSIQLGDPATIAYRTSITTVADFRAIDIASGGQGAPLVPAFHDAWFRVAGKDIVIVNIGGIANITALPAKPSDPIAGFDAGPGNCLLDDWISKVRQLSCDQDGLWAASGSVCDRLLGRLMKDKHILRTPPKSTGREYFNLKFLEDILEQTGTLNLKPEDIQATLLEYTVTSIVHGIQQTGISAKQVYVCGGGAQNGMLMSRLRASLPGSSVTSTAERDIEPGAVEAVAFAWLARQRLNLRPVRVTTGPRTLNHILGTVCVPTI
ncbi:MAG TPA: anhydro-N-acetylmuramic acid kinase [Gammaproteobacteria bacterium]|nr:anhydro-N-acetylmuramic acid kinase [Gammaproteobacteria bacterium]